MNNLQIFENQELNLQMRIIPNEDGSISINAEDTAIGFGWYKVEEKNGKKYMSIRWATLNGYCKEFGFANELAKDDFIPESLFYRLGMKANNERANKFQNWLALEVIPSIRKTGTYGHSVPSQELENLKRIVNTLRPILDCPADRLPYVEMVLKASGYIPSPKTAETPKKYSGQETVREFLQTAEISNRPTADVYEEYCDYCERYNISPIPHVVFSKCVNQMSDSEIIYKRISGKVKRCFI